MPESRELQIVELYRQLGPAVYRRCLRLLRDPEQAKDATQEVFLKLTRDIDRLGDRESMLPWIYRIATHHCLNQLRSLGRQARQRPFLEVREDCRELGYDEVHLSQQVLGRFDLTTQAIAVGVLVDGMEHAELASTLRLSSKTISRKLQRFLVDARKFLARSEP